MRFDWIIPCIGFSTNSGLAEIRGAGINQVRVQELPTPISFTVALKAVGLPADFTEDAPRDVEVYLTGPGMEGLISLDFELPVGIPPPDHPEGWETWIFVPLAIRFTATQVGHHMLDIYLNGRHYDSLPMTVALEISD